MFSGLSAFPLTPLTDEGLDEGEYSHLVGRLAAGVDSITVLGSTGNYAYLNRSERARAVSVAVENAGVVPVFASVGALGTREVLQHVEDAQAAGAAAVLLSAMSYQPLSDDEVFGLYEDVDANLSVPMVVYDNPITTHVSIPDELLGRIAELPSVASVKTQGVPNEASAIEARLAALRRHVPESVTIGLSDDVAGATSLLVGCRPWYSVLAGTLPEPCVAIARAALAGDADTARQLSLQMQPLWSLFARYGSLRVTAAVAELTRVTTGQTLRRPVQGLDTTGRLALVAALDVIGVDRGHNDR